MSLAKDLHTVLLVYLWWRLHLRKYSRRRGYFVIATQVLLPARTSGYGTWQKLTQYLTSDPERSVLLYTMLGRKLKQEHERYTSHFFEKVYSVVKKLCLENGYNKEKVFEVLDSGHFKEIDVPWAMSEQEKKEEPLLSELIDAFHYASDGFEFDNKLKFKFFFEYGQPEFVTQAEKYAQISREDWTIRQEMVWRLRTRCFPSIAEVNGEVPARVYEF
jgi:hypothetical protein